MGKFADLVKSLKENPQPARPKLPPSPQELDPEVLLSTRAAAAAVGMHLRSGKTAADALRALGILADELVGSNVEEHRRLNGDSDLNVEEVIKHLTADREKDVALIENTLLRFSLYVFPAETGEQ